MEPVTVGRVGVISEMSEIILGCIRVEEGGKGKRPTLSTHVAVLVQHDRAEPGEELALSIVFWQALPCGEKAFLHEIFWRIGAEQGCLAQ